VKNDFRNAATRFPFMGKNWSPLFLFLTGIDSQKCNHLSEALKSECMELFKDGLSAGEG
jgi:hypothetical protein